MPSLLEARSKRSNCKLKEIREVLGRIGGNDNIQWEQSESIRNSGRELFAEVSTSVSLGCSC